MLQPKRKGIRNIARKTITTTGRVLLTVIENLYDLNFALTYPSLAGRMGVKAGQAYLDYIHHKRRYVFHRLEKNNFISVRKLADKIEVKLSRDGKIAGLVLLMAQQDKQLAKSQVFLVSFDFPIIANSTRTFFRRTLKRIGFRYKHFSVWETDKDVVKEFTIFLKLLGVKRWVRAYLATETPG